MSRLRQPNKRRRLVARWALLCVVVTIAISAAVAASNRRDARPVPAVGTASEGVTNVLGGAGQASASPIRFADVSATRGISFRHFPAARESLLPEDMGSGVACGDYDGDRYCDLYFVNTSGPAVPGAAMDARAGRSRLYRNVGGERFEDVTDAAGVGFVGLGMGAAWGDYDNDGDADLYVTAYGANVLYRNNGDGTFTDVTAAAGVQDERFSTGCSWGDFDRDGHLDLYVCNYVAFAYRAEDRGVMERQYASEQPFTLNPSSYPPQPNALFRNRGDGTFEEVAVVAGVANPTGRSLSAAWLDMNNDGWPDLYVANDVSENGVYLNRRDGTFEDIGPSSLAADYRGAMGVAVGDIDDDLDLDLVITHWIAQENALYRNMLLDGVMQSGGRTWFIDDADNVGLGQISLDMVGWATSFCDFDHDGRRDLWIVNGHTMEEEADHRRLRPQAPLVFEARADGKYVEVAGASGAAWARPMVGRGGAQLDFDRDGRMDLVLCVHGGSPLLLRNESAAAGNWVAVELRQRGGNTAALGARVYVTAGGTTRMDELGSSPSYLSQNEPVVHFGIGAAERVDVVRIVWPDGAEEELRRVPVNERLRFEHRADYRAVRAAGVAEGA